MVKTVELVNAPGSTERVDLHDLEIARGGAGSVFAIENDPTRVVKIYHDKTLNTDGARYCGKIEAMVRQAPALPDIIQDGERIVQIAWPLALARDPGTRQFLGFSMPALNVGKTTEIEWMLNDRQAAKKGLRSDLGARVTVARQLAGVLAELHTAGHFVIDLKPLNARFYKDTLYMAFLDCDGFSIAHGNQRITAPQFTVDYLAPEFQSAGNPNDNPEQQDRFALAVVVFLLLNYGVHPYTGVPNNSNVPTEIPLRIQGNYYAYGQAPDHRISPNPASTHTCLPRAIRDLFDRAFGKNPSIRPSAAEWRDVLTGYASKKTGLLQICAQDSSHIHFSGMPCALCQKKAFITCMVVQNQVISRPIQQNTYYTPISPAHTVTPTATTAVHIRSGGLVLRTPTNAFSAPQVGHGTVQATTSNPSSAQNNALTAQQQAIAYHAWVINQVRSPIGIGLVLIAFALFEAWKYPMGFDTDNKNIADIRNAMKGNPGAMNNVGVMYKTGDGIDGGKSDQEFAVSWYIAAAKAGDVNAKSNLQGIYGDAKERADEALKGLDNVK